MRREDDDGNPVYFVGDPAGWENRIEILRDEEYVWALSVAPDVNWNNMSSVQHLLAAQRVLQATVMDQIGNPKIRLVDLNPSGFELAKAHLMAAQVKATIEGQPF